MSGTVRRQERCGSARWSIWDMRRPMVQDDWHGLRYAEDQVLRVMDPPLTCDGGRWGIDA